MALKVRKKFPLDWHQSMDGSSQPEVPGLGGQPLSSGKPDTLSWLTRTFSHFGPRNATLLRCFEKSPWKGSKAPWKGSLKVSCKLSGMFRRSASPAIPHRKKFRCDTVRFLSAPWTHESQRFAVTRIAAWACYFPSFRHFQDQFVATNRETWGTKTGLCFARFWLLTFPGRFASHDLNPNCTIQCHYPVLPSLSAGNSLISLMRRRLAN